MNDLEQRLRSAFDARARTFEASPDAWQRLQERKPRPSRARWVLAAVPVALLAVFVPVLLYGGLGRNSVTDPEGLYRQLMRDRTAAGEPARLDDPAGGRLRLWFARGGLGQPEVCYIAERPGVDPYGACDGMMEAQSDLSGWLEGSTARNGASGALDYGVARQVVTAVGAVTRSGRKITGRLWRPVGAPFQIWAVTYTAADPVTKFVFSRADGDDERPRSAPDHGPRGDERQAGAAVELPGGLVVAPYATRRGRELLWLRQGEVVGRLGLEGEHPLKDAPVSYVRGRNHVLGVARKDVARIRVTVAGGVEATAAVMPDPWNLGLLLFAAATPDTLGTSYRVAAQDAAGKEIWHKDWIPTPRREPNLGEQLGDTISIPGVEGTDHGPIRLRFYKLRQRLAGSRIGLCVTGGVGYDGREKRGCSGATHDDPSVFSHDTVDSYLPQPGTTVAFGAAPPSWESVDAVLLDGRRIHGGFVSAPGAPARVWYVKYPYGTDVAAYAFRVKGRRLEVVRRTRHVCWEGKTVRGRGHALSRDVTAVPLAGNCVRFYAKGQAVGTFEPVPGGRLRDMIAAERPLEWQQLKSDWYGFTLPGTARVEVALKGGGTATAETVPDPWGQGVMLFAGTVPAKQGKAGFSGPGLRFTGYDAAGRVLWTHRPPWPPY